MIGYDYIYNKVNAYIGSIEYTPEPENLYAPVKYVLGLGGKRIRPILMLMAYNLYKDDAEKILPNAAALEIYHNFTLLHDDLMDRADMRRGNPTVHRKWGDNTAILSGDAMLIMAYRLFTENNPNQSAIATFNEATLGVCDGQQYDMDFETRSDVKEEEYIEMIRLKTSLLLACALKIGAQLANASEEDAANLYDFGEKMGLAFQLQDDLLDVYGNPEVFGKKIGGDILCNKKTFMLINALQLANESDSERLKEWMEKTEFQPEEKISAVTAIYDAVDIKTQCINRIERYFEEALKSLEKVKVADEKKQVLRDFAHRLLNRKS